MPRLRPGIDDGVQHEGRVAHDDHGLYLLDAQRPRQRRPLRVGKKRGALVALSGGVARAGGEGKGGVRGR